MRIVIALLVTGLVLSCSDESLKRTGYETLQNIREQECYKNPSVECEQRERFEVYEERREDVKPAD